MGLIIKDKITMLKKGYPTVSDKYDVAGAVLDGSTPVQFGDPVVFSSTKGYFSAVPSSGLTSINQLAGITVATNVKVAQDWPATIVQINPGEAFNLLVKGFIAIELDSEATEASVTANSQVAMILATGKFTSADKIASTTVVAVPNAVFTGVVENHGTAVAPKLYAEIYIK